MVVVQPDNIIPAGHASKVHKVQSDYKSQRMHPKGYFFRNCPYLSDTMKKILTIWTALIISSAVNAQTAFQTTIDLGASENACDMVQTSDGGYAISGMQFFPSTNAMEVFLLRLDAAGSAQWCKRFSGGRANGANQYQNYRLMETEAGDFVIVGSTPVGSSSSDIYVIKTDAAGDTLWTRTYGDSGTEDGNNIFEDDNGNYVIGGSFLLGGQRRMGFLRIASDGTLLQQSYFADGIASPFFETLPLDSGRYGIVHSYSSLLNVVDTSGALLFSFPSVFSGAFSVDVKTSANGYSVFGAQSGLIGNIFAYAEIDHNGTVGYTAKYSLGTNDLSPRNMVRLANGNYLLYGLSTSMSGPSALLAVGLDANHTILFSNTYAVNTAAYHEAGRVIPTTDGGFAFLGQHDRSGQYSDFDVYVVKTDANGQSGCNQQPVTLTTGTPSLVALSLTYPYSGSLTNPGTPAGPVVTPVTSFNPTPLCNSTGLTDWMEEKVDFYPNPVHDRFTVSSRNSERVQITILNALGDVVREYVLSGTAEIDVSTLNTGLYVVRLADASGISRIGRLVKD